MYKFNEDTLAQSQEVSRTMHAFLHFMRYLSQALSVLGHRSRLFLCMHFRVHGLIHSDKRMRVHIEGLHCIGIGSTLGVWGIGPH